MEAGDSVEQVVEWIRGRYFGKYRGVVASNVDKTDRGRLKVQVPAVLGTLEVWAMPCVPYAGKGVGFYSLPERKSGVWVEFEGGDPSFPIWTGCFWADGELPPKSKAALKFWKTQKLTVRIDDDNDALGVEATSGSKVELTDKVKTTSGGATHTVGKDGVSSVKGTKRADVTDTAFTVNKGALEVT